MHSLESVICLPQRNAAAHNLGRTLVCIFFRGHWGLRMVYAVFVKGGVLWPVPLQLDKLRGMGRDLIPPTTR